MTDKEKNPHSEAMPSPTDNCQEKLSFLLMHSPLVCFEISLEGIILFMSPSINKISAFTDKDLQNRSMWNLYVDPTARELLMEVLYREGRLHDYRVELKDKNDQPRLCIINAILLGDSQGHPRSLFGTMTALD